ncbi:2'-5' RNA ligase family protein [Kribbella sp. CA-253562]|uniref:2'-5' RNA ligase family protein n=1 Tax=Kribbella sp. CA-253562 TaxID=3239942 RepID=UPI003D89B7D0
MTSPHEWTFRHAEQLTDHWWWRPGWKVGTRFYAWHINTFEDPAPIHRLAAHYQVELSTVPGLDLIPQQWLHLTMQGVGFVEDLSTAQVDALLEAARSRLAEVEPVKVRFQQPVIRPEAIALTPDPVEPVQEVRYAVRAAIADALGPGEVPDSAGGYQPHISLAYVSTPQPAIAALDAINRVTADPVDLTINAVSLIEMHRDNRMYEWQTVEAVPLGHSGWLPALVAPRPRSLEPWLSGFDSDRHHARESQESSLLGSELTVILSPWSTTRGTRAATSAGSATNPGSPRRTGSR